MTTIATRLQAVRGRIQAAAALAGRSAQDVRLIAVSKTFAVGAIIEANAAGQVAYGENYLQEALGKIMELDAFGLEWQAASPLAGPLLRPLEWHAASPDARSSEPQSDVHPSAGVTSPQAGPLLRPLEWHFIGPIQSNKTSQIAERFQWVHTVDRLKIAERLATARPSSLPRMDVCIQVNISSEDSKSGVRPDEVLALAQAICRLPGIRLRGLMAIPEPTLDTALQRDRFRQVRELKDDIVRNGIPLDMLSMGMSDDLEAAIAEGSTMVRIGRAIFGERPPFRRA